MYVSFVTFFRMKPQKKTEADKKKEGMKKCYQGIQIINRD